MARKRHLPKYVTAFVDRHGKERLRFRRKGFDSHYFKAELGTEEFRTEYKACKDGVGEVKPGSDRVIPGTIHALISQYVAIPTRLGPSATTQAKVRRILDHFRDKFGAAYVRDVTFSDIDEILLRKLDVQTVEVKGQGKRKVGGPEAAKKLRKELVRLFDYAIKIRLIDVNPVRLSDRIKIKAGKFHSWTEEEIAQYRARHKLGTMPRLAMELMLWTGQRRSDAYLIALTDIKGGWIAITQAKTDKAMKIPVAPQLLEAITAMPILPDEGPLLRTALGNPFTSAGFGNKMRDWCDDAGLPQCSSHGLRKATMRRLAELHMGNQSLKSVSGHSRDEEVRIYVEAANQQHLAAHAMKLLGDWEKSNLCLTEKTDTPESAEKGTSS